MKLHVPLPPVGFQRPRPRGKHSTAYYSPHANELAEWRLMLRNQMKLEAHPILEGPVSVKMFVGKLGTDIEVIPIIGAEPARPKGVRNDLDNIVKFNNDALEGPVYFDDVQVVDLSATFA